MANQKAFTGILGMIMAGAMLAAALQAQAAPTTASAILAGGSSGAWSTIYAKLPGVTHVSPDIRAGAAPTLPTKTIATMPQIPCRTWRRCA